MREVDLFPPESCRVAVDPLVTKPVSWLPPKPVNELDLEPVDGAPKKGKKTKLPTGPVPPCVRCARSKTNARCDPPLRPLKDKGGDAAFGKLLVVMYGFADSVSYVTTALRDAGWKGLIYFDLVVRCGTGDLDPKAVDACRGHLTFTVAWLKPDKILTCGSYAARAVIGTTMMVHQTRGIHQVVELCGKEVPIVSTCATVDAMTNRFYAAAFKREVDLLLNTPWELVMRPTGVAKVVETEADCAVFDAWRAGAPRLSFDLETSGIMFQADFRIVSAAIARVDSDEVFVFYESLANPVVVWYFLRALQEHRLDGWNIGYDVRSVLAQWGVDLSENIENDGRLAYKVLNAGYAADLEEVGATMGYGAHKAEAEAALEDAKKTVLDAYEAEHGTRKMKRPLAYAFGFLPGPIMERYVARDALVTARATEFYTRQAEAHDFLGKTYRTIQVPACRKFVRTSARGVLIDRPRLALTKAWLDERASELTARLKEVGIHNPDRPDEIRAFFEREGLKAKRLTPKAREAAIARGHAMGLSTPVVLDTDKRSTDKRALAALRDEHTAIADMIDYRKVSKLLSANVNTIVNYIGLDGRVHPTVNQDGAVTGRDCVTGDTVVWTDRGAMRMDELAEAVVDGGVRVLSHTGRCNKVLAVFCKPRYTMLHVKTDDGQVITCTPHHRVWTGESWVDVSSLRPGDRLETHVALPWGDVQPIVRMGRREALQEDPQVRGSQSGPPLNSNGQARFNENARDTCGSRHRECGVLGEMGGRVHGGGSGSREGTSGHPKDGEQVREACALPQPGPTGRVGGSGNDGRSRRVHRETVGHNTSPRAAKLQVPRDHITSTLGPPTTAATHQRKRVGDVGDVFTWSDASGASQGVRLEPAGALRATVQGTPACTGGARFHRRGGRWAQPLHRPWGEPPTDNFPQRVHHILSQPVRGNASAGATSSGGHAPCPVVGPSRVQGQAGVHTPVRLRLGRGKDPSGGGRDLTLRPRCFPASTVTGLEKASVGRGARFRRSPRDAQGLDHRPDGDGTTCAVTRHLARVLSIEPAGEHIIYDITVERDHSYSAHGMFHHNSMSDPALHGVPGSSDEGKRYKSCFIAAPGYKILVFDFNALEPWVAAFESGDPVMKDILINGKDFHTETAKGIAHIAWNISAEEVAEAIKSGDPKGYRKKAKITGLSTMYGIGPEALGEALGTTKAEGSKLIDGFNTLYAVYHKYTLTLHAFLGEKGYVVARCNGEFTRIRTLWGIGYPDMGRRGAAMRAAGNMPVQSAGSDYCQIAGTRVDAEFRATGIDAYLLLQVHDSLVVECREDLVQEVMVIVNKHMTNFSIPLRVKAEVGDNWGEAVETKIPS